MPEDTGDFTVVETNKYRAMTAEHLKIESIKEKARLIMDMYSSSTSAHKLANEILTSLTEDA